MELWVRSQDKEKLVLAKGFETQHTNYDGGCQIFAVWENNYQMVGKYKTKERALEVLDEIQNILKPQILIRRNDNNDKVLLGALQKGVKQKMDIEFKELPTYVYEMPKDEEE